MKAIVTGKEIKWQAERKNETTCQYFRGGVSGNYTGNLHEVPVCIARNGI